jgi:FkbM family methyltransferase
MEIGRINFLKIDTEGHELKVLQGAQNMLYIDYVQLNMGYL